MPQPLPAVHFQGRDAAGLGRAVCDSLLAPACLLEPALVRGPALCPHVRVERGSHIESPLPLPGSVVGRGATLHRVILDGACVVPDGMAIGVDVACDRERLHAASGGVTLATAQMLDPDGEPMFPFSANDSLKCLGVGPAIVTARSSRPPRAGSGGRGS